MKQRLLICCSILLLLVVQQVAARSEYLTKNHKQALASLYQQLSVDRERGKVAALQLVELSDTAHGYWMSLEPANATIHIVEARKLALAIAKTDIANAEQTLSDARDELRDVQAAVVHIESQIQDAKVSALDSETDQGQLLQLQARLAYLTTYADLMYQRVRVLQENMSINAKMVHYDEVIYQQVSKLYHQYANQVREKRLVELAEVLQKKKSELLKKLENYHDEIKNFKLEGRANAPAALIVNTRIYYIEEQIYLSDLTLNYRKIQDNIEDLKPIPGQRKNVSELDTRMRDLDVNMTNLEYYSERINAKQRLIRDKMLVLNSDPILQNNSEISRIFTDLQNAYDEAFKQNRELLELGVTVRAQIKSATSSAIAERQGLPGWDWLAWQRLFKKIWQITQLTANACTTLRDHVIIVASSVSPSTLILLFILAFTYLLSLLRMPYLLQGLLAAVAKSKPKSSTNLAYIVLHLAAKECYLLLTIVTLFTALIVLGVAYKYYKFALYLALTLVAFRCILRLAHLTLVENYSNVFGNDVALYIRLKWSFLFGGIITALNVLAAQINTAYEVRDILMRLLMVFLLIVSLILYRGRAVLPTLLAPYISYHRNYLNRATSLLSTLLPFILMSNAIVGLLGYVELVWVMRYYQLVIVTVLAAYVVLHGLMVDFADLMADLAIRNLQNGWLLTQAFLKPLVSLTRIAMIVGAAAMLFQSFGWDHQSWIVLHALHVLNYNVIPFSGYQISIYNILLFATLIAIVFWAARWTREFSYRYFLRDVQDQGIRNSLSLFFQYVVVLTGAILTLRILGIDFGDLSYVIGGLAVGLGFGLRDFANNIVSGIMLLIERPVREGDIVSVAGHEGIVTHIGLRSMVVRSWDHMEVMIPNAETLNKTFVNWTHNDHVVRTIIPIKVHPNDDPVKVQAILVDVLRSIPDVLVDPEPEVLLLNMNECLLELEARYFVNLATASRILVRSQVLYAIWERFKTANIRAPNLQHDIHVRQEAQKDVAENL